MLHSEQKLYFMKHFPFTQGLFWSLINVSRIVQKYIEGKPTGQILFFFFYFLHKKKQHQNKAILVNHIAYIVCFLVMFICFLFYLHKSGITL